MAEHLFVLFNGKTMFGKTVQFTLVSGKQRWDEEQALKVSNAVMT